MVHKLSDAFKTFFKEIIKTKKQNIKYNFLDFLPMSIQTQHVFSVDPYGHDHPGSSKMEVSSLRGLLPGTPNHHKSSISGVFPWNQPVFFGVPPWHSMTIAPSRGQICQGQGVFVVGVVGGWLWYLVMPWYHVMAMNMKFIGLKFMGFNGIWSDLMGFNDI